MRRVTQTRIRLGRIARRGNERAVAFHRAFSMIELLVSIGVILVLLGIFLPALGGSIDHARQTADLAVVRSNSALVLQFTSENGNLYPRATDLRCSSAKEWYAPLLDRGLFGSMEQVEPRSYREFGVVTIRLSQSLIADPAEFEWGRTRPCDESPSSDVAEHLVLHPSAKGMMVKFADLATFEPRTGGPRWFCCSYLWPAPVSFCDGSAEVGSRDRYYPGGVEPAIVHQHSVGVPILSPWGGYMARER